MVGALAPALALALNRLFVPEWRKRRRKSRGVTSSNEKLVESLSPPSPICRESILGRQRCTSNVFWPREITFSPNSVLGRSLLPLRLSSSPPRSAQSDGESAGIRSWGGDVDDPGCGIGHEGSRLLGESLSCNRTLRILCLRGNMLEDVGARFLGVALEKSMSIELLDVSDNHITCRGAWSLTDSLRLNQTLQELRLEGLWGAPFPLSLFGSRFCACLWRRTSFLPRLRALDCNRGSVQHHDNCVVKISSLQELCIAAV